MNTKHLAHELTMIAQRLAELASQVASERVAQAEQTPTACLVFGKPYKPGRAPVRGCHYSCYRNIIRMVKQGLLTDDDAVRSGKLLPPKPGGRGPSKDRMERAARIREEARLAAEKAQGSAKAKE